MRIDRSLPFLGMPVGWNPQLVRPIMKMSENMDLFSTTTTALQKTMTSDSVAHTMGAWSEVVASTSSDIYGLIFRVTNNQTGGTDCSALMDIGVGAAGSEVVVAPFVDISFQGTAAGILFEHQIPVYIPSGSRIAMRCQSVRTSRSISVDFRGALSTDISEQRLKTQWLPQSLVSYGHNTATSNLTVLTAPASFNTKGAWKEIVAATSEPLQGIVIFANAGPTTAMQASNYLVDVGLGASGSETVIAANSWFRSTTAESSFSESFLRMYPVDVPAGSRLSMRYQRSAAVALYASIIGIPK